MGYLFDLERDCKVDGYPLPPFLRHVGVKHVSVRPGFATLTWVFDPAIHANGLGVAHGGVLSTLLDIVMGYASGFDNGKVGGVVTTSMTTHYLSPAQNTLTVSAHVNRKTKHIVFCSADVANPDGSLVAQAVATFKRLAPRLANDTRPEHPPTLPETAHA